MNLQTTMVLDENQYKDFTNKIDVPYIVDMDFIHNTFKVTLLEKSKIFNQGELSWEIH